MRNAPGWPTEAPIGAVRHELKAGVVGVPRLISALTPAAPLPRLRREVDAHAPYGPSEGPGSLKSGSIGVATAPRSRRATSTTAPFVGT
jgi:hypothetical protein